MLRHFSISVSEQGVPPNGHARAPVMIFAAERQAGIQTRAQLGEKLAVHTGHLSQQTRDKLLQALSACPRISDTQPFFFEADGVTVKIEPTRGTGCTDDIGFDTGIGAGEGHGWGN